MKVNDTDLNQTYIDLRGTPCPLNFVKCKLAIESLEPNQSLKIDLDKGEPEEMVITSLEKEGHQLSIINNQSNWVTIIID